jgi:hypothetical protein
MMTISNWPEGLARIGIVLGIFMPGLLLAGCSSFRVEQESLVRLDLGEGAAFELSEGHSAFLSELNITVVFEELVSDSRCPISGETTINCFWEGSIQATILIEHESDTFSLAFEGFLGDGTDPLQETAGSYVVFMDSMDPYPVYEEQNDDPKVATLRIESLMQ